MSRLDPRDRDLPARARPRLVHALQPQPGVPRPRATYRVQLHAGFGFDAAAAIADYLAELGVSHLYCSPYLQAAPGSTHGYDVLDHRGSTRSWAARRPTRASAKRSARQGLGQVLDIVPNHMAITERAQRLVVGRAGERPGQPLCRTTSTSTGTRPRRGCTTRCCCRSWATTTAACSRRASSRSCAEAAKFEIHYHDHRLPVAPRSLDILLGARRRALRLAGPGLPRRRLRRPPPATATDRASSAAPPPRQGGAARPARPPRPRAAGGRRGDRRGGRGDQRRSRPPRRAAGAPELPPGLLAHAPAASSTTGASSTSTRWSACGWRTRGSSPTRTR